MNSKGKNTLFCFVNVYNNGEETILVLLIRKSSSKSLKVCTFIFICLTCSKQAPHEKMCGIRGTCFSLLCNRCFVMTVIWGNGDAEVN